MTGTLALARLLLRRNRIRIAAWTVPLVLLVAVTVPGYASTYPSLSERGPLVRQLRDTVATKVLYGQLPLPGTLGQLAQWETGTYVVLSVSVMAVVLAVSFTRRDEDCGLTELANAAGVGRWAQTCASALVLTGVFVALGAITSGVLAIESVGHPGDLTLPGAACFGAVVALVGIGTAAQTMLVAEILWDAHSALRIAWVVVGTGFAARVLADFTSLTWLRTLTWFGVRDLVRPYSDDRVLPLVAGAVVASVLGALAALAHARREFGAGLVHLSVRPGRPLRIRSAFGLAWRLDRGRLMIWAAPAVAISALFGGMSHGLVGLLRDDAGTADLLHRMTASSDPVRQYFSFSYVFVAILPLVYGVATVLRVRADERAGLVDVQLATGVSRWRPLAGRTVEAAAGAVALLVLGAAVQPLTARAVLGGAPSGGSVQWAFWAPLCQVPGVVAAAGLAGLAVGVAPRLAGAVWIVVAWSGFAVLLGALARVPDGIRRIAVLGHLPPATTGAAVVLIAGGIGAALCGWAAMTVRDVIAG
ncbi:hypothetical protein P0W64_21390 [Tsukamurella sp. 8F]|uniref:hypothetical protein n=1 Tax=unclassified Tsukamurella TaxID=2633480 RepID=UPI0023BA1612|nr:MULTISPECIES: hypothetical protein [unclassified Tsukamurella]MDF0532592.1 hypothetical protein [Tsukamurella sp. 8J]MDF0589339.1 hypothetical protein [Tsukamurella sp. 8F]